MADPFIGEIRIFSGNFAPSGWFLCQGQLLAISQYQALFALLGTNYGGNGTTNFQLPNLQGRFPIGMGTAPSGQVYNVGEAGGVEQLQLTINNLPPHSHAAVAQPHEHSVSVPAHTHPFTVPAHTHPFALTCNANIAAEPSPGGNVPGNSGSPNYDTSGSQQMASQNTDASDGQTAGTTGSASGTSGNTGAATATVTIQTTGAGLPFSPTPLYTAINYIIAYQGIYPTRS